MSAKDVLAWIVIIGAIIGAILGFDWFMCTTYAGKTYDVSVKVANVERSERFYKHTNVWVEQFISSEGREALKYHLLGHHEFTPGKSYRIVWRNKILFNIFKGFFFIAGEVIKIEEIG